jgi:hypothetical protein
MWRQRPRSAVLISRLKNIVGWFVVREKHCSGWKNKLKKTDYKPGEQSQTTNSRLRYHEGVELVVKWPSCICSLKGLLFNKTWGYLSHLYRYTKARTSINIPFDMYSTDMIRNECKFELILSIWCWFIVIFTNILQKLPSTTLQVLLLLHSNIHISPLGWHCDILHKMR